MLSHKKYMEFALKLAEKGRGKTSPNPIVGAIIVKRGQIIGRGYHKKAGQEHAEINALNDAGKKAANAIMYVTLEPCSHWGKTPPCTERIVESGIKEVVIAMKDPNPKVDGYNVLKLRGIKTRIGILEKEAKELNEFYIHWMKNKMPFVIVKSATSLDGKIATRTGDSKYISGTEARKYVHQLRNDVDAVMVGINTVLKDDPQLTPRLVSGKDPIKIVVDSKLRIQIKLKLMKDPTKLIVATTKMAPKAKVKMLKQKGVNVIIAPVKRGMVDLEKLMKELNKLEITSIMIEGGSELNADAIRSGIVNKIIFFISPALIGEGVEAIGDLGIKKVDRRIKLKRIITKRIGKDILVEGYI